MITSEIAKISGRSASFPKRQGAAKTNPKILAHQDGVVLSAGAQSNKNLSHGAKISATVQNVRLSLNEGKQRSLRVLNTASQSGEIKYRPSTTRFTNPEPIDIDGQVWNIRG